MAGVESYSEYGGGGVMPNTVFPMGSDALTPSDKLRLQSLTGQETDSQAPLDDQFWHGNQQYDTTLELREQNARAQKQRTIARRERNRYRETP